MPTVEATFCGCHLPACGTATYQECKEIGGAGEYGTPLTEWVDSEILILTPPQPKGTTRDRDDRDEVVERFDLFVIPQVGQNISPRGRIVWCGDCFEIEAAQLHHAPCGTCASDWAAHHWELELKKASG